MPIVKELAASRPDVPEPDRESWYELHDLQPR
jgi:hypothetical protein